MTIFALATDDLGLIVFPGETEAVAYCEGIDVEEGVWEFWDANGDPLRARFVVPNETTGFSVVSGKYKLEKDPLGQNLITVLDRVSGVQGMKGFTDIADVRAHLTSQGVGRATRTDT